MTFAHLSSNVSLLGFAVASVLYLVGVQKSERSRWVSHAAFGIFVAAAVACTLCLLLMTNDPSLGPGSLGRGLSGSVSSSEGPLGAASLMDVSGILLTVAISWLAIVGHWRYGLRLIGAFVAPLATLMLLVQFFLMPMRAFEDLGTNQPIMVKAHIALAVLGQAFAIMACGVSVLFLWQQNLLKKKLLGQMSQSLPAIDRLEFLLMTSLWAGFVFLTLGLISGALFARVDTVARQNLDIKVTWAILVWAWYLATLIARNVFSRPSKRIAQMALAGFMLLAMTYFGMGIFRPFGGG